jgi:hypothetical protein
MGLDMYLYKKTYVKQWSHQPKENQFLVTVKKGGVTFPNIKPERVSYITEQIMYWRKANQIHGWFTSNGQELIEEVSYRLTLDDLKNLLDTCKQVLDVLNKSKMKTVQVRSGWSGGEEMFVGVDVYDCEEEIMELLPPTQGFFYGSSDINEYYKEEVEETIQFLEKEIPLCTDDDEFEYYASW